LGWLSLIITGNIKMKKTATVAGGGTAAAGGAGIYDNWYCWGPNDVCIAPYVQDSVTPLLVIFGFLAAYVLFRLWRRLKKLEAR
jgi:hypothetical protein